MERYTVDNLKPGTLDALRKRALKKKVTQVNGEPWLAKYVRDLMEKDAAK